MAASHFHQFGSRQFCSALRFLIIFRLCLIQSTQVRSGCEMALTSPQAQQVKKTLNKWNSQTDKMAEHMRNNCYFISRVETSSTAEGTWRGGCWGSSQSAFCFKLHGRIREGTHTHTHRSRVLWWRCRCCLAEQCEGHSVSRGSLGPLHGCPVNALASEYGVRVVTPCHTTSPHVCIFLFIKYDTNMPETVWAHAHRENFFKKKGH